MGRVGDVKQSEVTVAVLIAVATGCRAIGVAARRHTGIGEGAAQVGAVLNFKFVHTPRAAAGVQVANLDRHGRIGHVPQYQAAVGVGVVARVAAVLDAGGGDVVIAERAIARGIHNDVFG